MNNNKCLYCSIIIPEDLRVCPNCEEKIKFGMMPRDRINLPNNNLKQSRLRRFKPIYKPSGRAYEYGEYACNIYTGCDNGCWYCCAPKILHISRSQFEHVQPRMGIVNAVREQLSTTKIRGKFITLCFSCDPYPLNCDSTPTRLIIEAIKTSGNHVQILTKNPINRDFDLLDENDWFGVTLTSDNDKSAVNEPKAFNTMERISILYNAAFYGIKTWISLEPVIDPDFCYDIVSGCDVDMIRIGKLNYYPSNINWKEFGIKIEHLCKLHKRNYYIKEDLRKEM